MSLDATFYGFATLADAQAAWHEQLARILQTSIDRGVIIDDLLGSPPATPQIVSTDGAAPAILWDVWRSLEAGSIASSYWQTVTGESYELLAAESDDFCQQLALGITKYIGACRANARAIGDDIDAAATIADVIVIDMASGWPSNELAAGIPFRQAWAIAGSFEGEIPASEVVMRVKFHRSVTFDVDMVPSAAEAETAATASTTFTIKKVVAGTPTNVGSINWASSATVATFTMATATTFDDDSTMLVVGPASSDATLASIAISLAGFV